MDSNLKQRIIEETYKLFIIKGIDQTSFCDIANAVSKSKGAIIHYFPSKKVLIDTVIRRCFFPASELPSEFKKHCYKNGWSFFIKSYKNPIERAMYSFPEDTKDNQLMHYLEFVSSASKYMRDFSLLYKDLFYQEEQSIIEIAHKNQICNIIDIDYLGKQTIELSIGHTFCHFFLGD